MLFDVRDSKLELLYPNTMIGKKNASQNPRQQNYKKSIIKHELEFGIHYEIKYEIS